MSTSSSTAAPRGRFAWRSARDERGPTAPSNGQPLPRLRGRLGWGEAVRRASRSRRPPMPTFPRKRGKGFSRLATARLMARAQTRYVCQECGSVAPKWQGKCEACGAWNAMIEEVAEAAPKGVRAAKGKAIAVVRLASTAQPAQRRGERGGDGPPRARGGRAPR